MKILNALEEIKDLPHDSKVKNALLSELVKPFDSIQFANQFWGMTSTTLVAVLPTDESDILLDECSDLFAPFSCVEFIEPLVDGWSLALAITSQDGGGRYLLFSSVRHSKLTTLLFT